MAENEQEIRHYTPQHPLPDGIKKMERDETVCRYCGVSYLIHNEIKALELKVKNLEKEVEYYKSFEERENQIRSELKRLQDERGEFEMNLTVKDAAIASLSSNLQSAEELSDKLRSQRDEATERMEAAEKLSDTLRERNTNYERSLPAIRFALRQQKGALEDIHAFMEVRDQQTQEEMAVLLSHVKSTCEKEIKEKEELTARISQLKSAHSETSALSEEMRQQYLQQEEELRVLRKVQDKNEDLEERYSALESRLSDVKKELEEAVAKSRGLTLEVKQFKDQLKNKTIEVEEMTANHRRKEQNFEMTTQKLEKDLKKKEADLTAAQKELKNLENKFYEQQEREEDLSRKAHRNTHEAKDLKEALFSAKEEIEKLKEEREVMITSHQNRIEQLRESFKEKISEAEKWPEKLDAALQKEKEKHDAEMKALASKLKENFIMEMEIEKQKYEELMRQVQSGSKDSEDKLRAQLMSMESKYKSEIDDLEALLAQNKSRAKEMEESLRREIEGLKSIIRDLESRIGRLNYENEEMVNKFRTQLQETHHELEGTRKQLEIKDEEMKGAKEEIGVLQETVRKECEERFELTEALGEAREELLHFKKPSGGYPTPLPRQNTNMSIPPGPKVDKNPPNVGGVGGHLRRSTTVPVKNVTTRPASSRPRVSTSPTRKEYTVKQNNTMVFPSDMSSTEVGRTKNEGTLAQNRRRIAAILGRKN